MHWLAQGLRKVKFRNAGLDEAQLESRLPRDMSVTSDMQMTPPYGRKQRAEEPLDENERGE